MVASTKVSQIRAVPSGSANPRVNSDDPLISKERWALSWLMAQKTNEKPKVTESIQTRGRLTSATGA